MREVDINFFIYISEGILSEWGREGLECKA